MKRLRQTREVKDSRLEDGERQIHLVPTMRRVLIPVAIAGLFALLFPAVLLFTMPSVQLPLLAIASLSLGSAIGVLVRPLRLASVAAAGALGIGAFMGAVFSMEILSLQEPTTADWWRAAMTVSLIAGLLHGALGAVSAYTIGLALRARRTQGAEIRSA